MERKSDPVLLYGLVGVVAVGVISLALLTIIIVGAPADQFVLTSFEAGVSREK